MLFPFNSCLFGYEPDLFLSQFMSEYKIEYAKSNRAGCRKCSDNIEKDAPRIGKLVPSDKFDGVHIVLYLIGTGEFYVWFHVPCFFEKHSVTRDELQGFSMIRPTDQSQVLKYINSTQPKKRTNDEIIEPDSQKKQKTEDPKQLKKLWDYIDMCKTICTGNEIQEILELNNQSTRGSFQELAYRVSDGLLNGSVPHCPDCKNKSLVFEDGKYRCYGDATAWSKCNFQCDTENSAIRRTSWNSPKWFTVRMKDHFDAKSGRSSYSSGTSSNSNNNNSSIPCPVTQNEVFDGTTFCLVGKFSKPRGLVIKDLKKHGAIIAMNNNLNDVDYLITDGASAAAALPGAAPIDDADTETIAVIQEAYQRGIPVLKEDFLWDSIEQKKQQKAAQYKFPTKVSKPTPSSTPFLLPSFGISNHHPTNNGNSSDDDIATPLVSTSLSSNPFHGRTVEDPDPYFKDNNIPVQIHKDRKNNLYSTILNRTDVSVGLRGLNSFYEIQALENTQKKIFYLFKRWGRVGNAGSFKCTEYETLEAALEAFKGAFLDKTGNKWEDRDRFVKKPNKFYPVGVDIHLEKENRITKYLEVSKSTRSSLDPRVASLVSLIFDLKLMKDTLAQLDIDLAKMPLGKLTKSQIKDGYICLSEIQDALGKPNTRAKILELTNKFYTLIPQDFGSKRPPMIDSADVVADKITLLETLSNIQIALGMLESDSDDNNSEVIDSSYAKLCTKLTPVEKSSSLYQMLEKYATQPSQWMQMQVLEIFQVEREGEAQRFSPWQFNKNRKLLWHGSGLSNFVGILSQGLRIAPPEAPVSGYRFGKGIYFADLVTKSAGYCRASIAQPEAILLLNEVALGTMYETHEDEYMEKPPPGYDSTKAVGMCAPDPAFDQLMDDGVVVPLGPPVTNEELETSCYDNEYIVYDVSQVKIRYLLKVKLY